jgi:ABC-type spermidine/putrescine transport system permease subunit II
MTRRLAWRTGTVITLLALATTTAVVLGTTAALALARPRVGGLLALATLVVVGETYLLAWWPMEADDVRE